MVFGWLQECDWLYVRAERIIVEYDETRVVCCPCS